MAKQNNQQQQSNSCSLHDCEIRPVTKADKWCERKMPKGEESSEAPFDYIVTIPYCPNQNTILKDIDGYIVRSKKHCGKLLLQIIKKDCAPQYGVKSAARHEPNARKGRRRNKKKLYRILSIKNLDKSEGRWGKAIY